MKTFTVRCLAIAAAPPVAAPIDQIFAKVIGRIEGRHDGRERLIDYPRKRVACPGGAR